MTDDKGILIRNIFHMLSYAFAELRQESYEKIAGEKFEYIHDLLAAILASGIPLRFKQGLHREYIPFREELTTLRGRVDIAGNMRNIMLRRSRLDCEYDELSENCLCNRILKTTILLLLRHREVKSERKTALRRLLPMFDNVAEIDMRDVRWDSLRFDRNNRPYRMLMFICRFVAENILLTTDSGRYEMHRLTESNMARLYEKFILEYYRRHRPQLNPRVEDISWGIDRSLSDAVSLGVLPKMRTDIVLSTGSRTLIIDAKYYGSPMGVHFGAATLHSPNIYQIYSYVMNYDSSRSGKVDGMLLYAQTRDIGPMRYDYHLREGNRLFIRSLDLNSDFSNIEEQLLAIADLCIRQR